MEARARELFVHGLKDAYDAEHRFADGLHDMIRAVDDQRLADALQRHRRVTVEQIDRLERVFRMVDAQPRRERCKGAEGLVDEYSSFIRQRHDAETVDAFTPAAGLKAEHYEIATYTTLVEMARLLGASEAANLLEDSLDEEKDAAREFEAMSLAMSARLAGVRPGGIIQRTVSSLGEVVREGAKLAAGAADVMFERASDMVERAETRGRRATGNAKRSGTRKTSGTRRSTAKRSTAGRRTTASSRSGRKTTARRSTTSRTTSGRSTTRSGARKPASRRTTGRSTTRKTAGGRTTRRPASRKTTGTRTTRRPASRKTAGARTTRRPASRKTSRTRSSR